MDFKDLELKSRKELDTQFRATPDESKFLIPYKNKLYEDLSKKRSFFTEYFGKHLLSKSYKDFVYSKIYYPYVSSLLAKYVRIKDSDERTTSSYFQGITPAKLQNDEFANSSEYSYGLFTFLINYWAKPDLDAPITTIIKKQFDFVKSTFKKNTKDILLARLFKRYFEMGNPEYHDFISKEYQESKQIFFQKDYYERLIPYYTRYMMFEMDMSKDTKTLVRKISGEEESIGKVMESLKGNVVYLDLWASWCGPCRDEMPHSEKLVQVYSGKNVKFVYLSTDDKTDAWKKAFSEFKMDDSNSFLLDNSTKELFTKSINLTGIPRYILIDKNGKIVDGDAPRPSEARLRSLIDRCLE